MKRKKNDGEYSPLDLADVSDSEDEEEGYHSDDLLSEMEGEEFAMSLDLQMQNGIEFLRAHNTGLMIVRSRIKLYLSSRGCMAQSIKL